MEILTHWQNHQNVLRKLVKRMTGKSVESILKEDAYTFFLDMFNQNFEGVSPLEINDCIGLMNNLKEYYPDELHKAFRDTKLKGLTLIKKGKIF